MTLSRNQLIGAVAGVILLVGVGVYVGRGTRPADGPAIPPAPPLPTGRVTGLPPQAQQEVEFLTRGAMLFVFLHEAGHMVIGEMKIPATGPQEDVADEFATFVLTDAMKAAPDNEKDIYANVIFAGAVYWRLAAQQREQGGGGIAWYDEHSPDLRRYYGILCLATGADPLRFIPMAVKDGVPETRLRSCAEEYKTKHEAWDTLMAPHVPGFFRRTFGVRKMTLQTGPAMKNEWLGFENVYHQGGFFQSMLDNMSKAVDLPRDVPVIVKGCGVVNAFYSPDKHTITLCYDFAEHVSEMFAQNAAAQIAAQQAKQQGGGGAGGGGGAPPPNVPNPQPPPNPPPNAPPQSLPAQLIGSWQCAVNMGNGTVNEQFTLRPDGAFNVQVQMQGGANASAWGRWSVVGGQQLRFDYEGPPGIPSPEFVPFQMPQANTLRTPTGTCNKIGQP